MWRTLRPHAVGGEEQPTIKRPGENGRDSGQTQDERYTTAGKEKKKESKNESRTAARGKNRVSDSTF